MWNYGIVQFPCQLLFILKKLKFHTTYEEPTAYVEDTSLQIFEQCLH